MHTQINKSWERHVMQKQKGICYNSYWASGRIRFETKSMMLHVHVASERHFCCRSFFSFPQVRGDLFGFTRLTDGPEIHSYVPLTDMAMPFLSTWTSKGPSTLQCESNRIQIRFELIWVNPDQSGLGRFSTSLSLLETNRFSDIIHRHRHVTNAPHP